jgi:hypothetical protein
MFKLRDRERIWEEKKEKYVLAEIRSSVGWSLFFKCFSLDQVTRHKSKKEKVID